MFYGDNRNDIRQVYFDAWQAANNKQPLDALQQQIVEVIQFHPEYQPFLSRSDNLDKDFNPEQGQTNPFLHMGMHMAIKEQLSINQPTGIRDIYQKLLLKHTDAHQVEHQMMDCIAEMIWQAQSKQQTPDMEAYVRQLRGLV
ncbi:MAG: DUF1841 family protein [Thiohalomonadales bacterium]